MTDSAKHNDDHAGHVHTDLETSASHSMPQPGGHRVADQRHFALKPGAIGLPMKVTRLPDTGPSFVRRPGVEDLSTTADILG